MIDPSGSQSLPNPNNHPQAANLWAQYGAHMCIKP